MINGDYIMVIAPDDYPYKNIEEDIVMNIF